MTAPSFGVNLRGAASLSAFNEVIRRADGLGCDVICAPDHLGAQDPFVTLVAAAQTSPRARLRTYVLNVGFWNPALLARVAATTDLLTDGRLELGLGAGHMRSEHEDAGLPWHPHRARVERLGATLEEVRRRLGDPGHRPPPVQRPIPIAVAAMTPPGLRIAAEHAEIVAFSGLLQMPGGPPGTFIFASAEETDRRVAEVRELAAGRPYTTDALIQMIVIGEEPAVTAARLAKEFGEGSAERLLDTPFMLMARDPSHAAEIIAERRERFGFDCFTAHEPSLEGLGQVIAACRR